MNFNDMLSNLKRDAAAVPLASARVAKRNKAESSVPRQDRSFPKAKVDAVYLICPPNVQTGGPEAMHQLCDKINSLGDSSEISAYMLYIEDRNGRAYMKCDSETHPAYLMYQNVKVCNEWTPETSHDGDEYNGSLLVWPEIWTNLISSVKGKHQNAIWWLSVDNNNGKFQEWERKDLLHLHQSEYARCHIEDNLRKARNFDPKQVLPMTEYISLKSDVPETSRDLEIVYNPLKGIHYTDGIRKRSGKKFSFTPIGGAKKRLSQLEVSKLLHRAKIYIDFGPHPGMDRLPREAALAKCIIITNKDGSAFYNEDVPVPRIYKIADFDVNAVHQLLSECINGYIDKTKDFDSYREWISTQEGRMNTCVKSLINTIVKNRSK